LLTKSRDTSASRTELADTKKVTDKMKAILILGDGIADAKALPGSSPPADTVRVSTLGALTSYLSQQRGLALMDLTFPETDGADVCARLRKELDIPVLMVGDSGSAKAPYSASRGRTALPFLDEEDLERDSLRLCPRSRGVFVNGKEVSLKNREFELLYYLISHPDQVFSREHLYERLWGQDPGGNTTTVTVHINRLREKIEDDPAAPRYIKTVWGIGYQYKAQDSNQTK